MFFVSITYYDIINRLAELQNSVLLWDDTELYATQASAAPGLGGVFDTSRGDTPLLVQKCILVRSKQP